MAETLTYDPGTDTVTSDTIENLTPDEQESLKVGEELQEQQEQLLAGKYKNAEDLEKAYVELEKKLGSDTKEEVKAEEPETKEEPSETNILDTLWEEASNSKEYKKETLEQLSKMDPTDLANLHLQYRQANQAPKSKDLTEQDVTQLQDIVGGKDNYRNMMQWAKQNLNEQEVSMFDQVMERGDPLAAFFAVRSLAYRFNDASGYEGELLTGSAPKAQADGFKSQAEVVEAMSDPRYDRDPAYRQEVMKKLERSNVNF